MSIEELKALNLPVKTDDLTCLYVDSGIDWLVSNTTLVIDKDNLTASIKSLPSGAKLFLCRYVDIMQQETNVTSESIGGMSQSFGTTSKNTQLYNLARELIGQYLKSGIRVVGNVSKWK